MNFIKATGSTVIKLEKILEDLDIQFSMLSKYISKFMISVNNICEFFLNNSHNCNKINIVILWNNIASFYISVHSHTQIVLCLFLFLFIWA